MVLMDVAELVSLLDRTSHGILSVPDRVNLCLVPIAPTPALSSLNVRRQRAGEVDCDLRRLSACRRKRVRALRWRLGQRHDPAFQCDCGLDCQD